MCHKQIQWTWDSSVYLGNYFYKCSEPLFVRFLWFNTSHGGHCVKNPACLKRLLILYCISLVNYKILKGVAGTSSKYAIRFPISRSIEVIGYFNASLKSIFSPRITPDACLSSFITDIALGVFLYLLQPCSVRFSVLRSVLR